MGLDIFVSFDNQESLNKIEDFSTLESKLGLSRTFCYLMNSDELHGLGKITGIDISFLYKMRDYLIVLEQDEMLFIEEEEKQKREEEILKLNEEISNNIDEVTESLTLLLDKMKIISALAKKLGFKQGSSFYGSQDYFSDFNPHLIGGYASDSLGYDLQNLLKLINFASDNDSKSVFFWFG